MRRAISVLIVLGVAVSVFACHPAPPPPRVPVPGEYDRGPGRPEEPMRPLPPHAYAEPPIQPPFVDEPLLAQRPPEQRAFVEAYQRIGAPRIMLFVYGVEDRGTAAIDFDAIETIMTDWLSGNGQVTLVAPTINRRRLTSPQTRENLARDLDADVVVYVQAAQTRQTPHGPEMRIVAQSINTRGGEQIARAVVDVPPPLDKPQINDYTRFLARKLMDDMTASWNAMQPAPAPQR